MRRWLVGLSLLASLLIAGTPAAAQRALSPDEVPTFMWRCRVVQLGGKDPQEAKLSFHLESKGANVVGPAWSEWQSFDREQIAANLKGYPAIYLKSYPVVLHLTVRGVVDPTRIEMELKFDEGGEPIAMAGELFGPTLGLLVWREADRKPRGATMAEYNRRYWKILADVHIPGAERPKKFPIVDRFIGGDDDRIAWREGIEALNKAGFSAIMLPPSKPVRELLLQAGQRRTAWAVYSPPGYAFDHDPKITPDEITKWAEGQAKPYLDAGYAKEDMAVFAMSDEPGWYFPKAFEPLAANPAALARFRDYLKSQGLKPEDVGARDWGTVQPLGRSKAKDLASKRLFYWTMRFFSHDSTRHFAASTKALEQAFYPGMPIFTNWNFFAGRFYVPGPVANNADKTSPDAAMGGHDWMEFGRMRGGTMLWTEDWFGDGNAFQWSFYCAKLRSAAAKSNIEFGGYVIPRTAGEREDGIVQKILCVVGSGGKTVKYFVFGPEYNFPGNCYSERAAVLPQMAEAHRMIGKAEELLWPGRPPRSEVAILMPRSAQAWDAQEVEIPKMISDATNHHMNHATVDYMAEVFNLYLALQHANIPADFVDEDDLSPDRLQGYKALYVTAPNLPEEGQRGLLAWVHEGGTLITVSGAAQADRYDQPCSILADGLKLHEKPRPRLLIANGHSLKSVGRVESGTVRAAWELFGAQGELIEEEGVETLATFADDKPATRSRRVQAGRAVQFAWLPGLSYWRTGKITVDRLPGGFSESLRNLIVAPALEAGVTPPVTTDRPLVETPLLISDKGAAVTLLNWTGAKVDSVELTARVPFAVKSVESVRRGPMSFAASEGAIKLSVPLGAADILLLRP